MTRPSRYVVFLVTGLAVGLSLPSQPVFAQDSYTDTKATTRKSHKVQRHSYPRLESHRSSDFVGQFPGSCAYDRAAGACMIDLGYGRCMPCSSGPLK
jgi:hypothetical protein